MQQYLLYLIPIAVVLIIFIVAFKISRRVASKKATASDTVGSGQTADTTHISSGIYEASGVNQHSDHPLGAVQSVIRGRIRFVLFGLVALGVALFGLYVLHLTDIEFFVPRTPVNVLIATVISVGLAVYGFYLISFAFCRIKLRRTGFELCGVFGAKAYEYKNMDFHLTRTVESKYNANGYRPVVMKTETFNFIWVCQILFNDGRKPIVLKSSRYAWLYDKMAAAIDGLYGKK